MAERVQAHAPVRNQARIQPMPPLPAALAAAAAASAAPAGSRIGPGTIIAGRVTCAGEVRVLGRIAGDLTAGQVFVGDNAVIEGDIAAREATVRGCVRGDIRAVRVRLQGYCVVAGDIFHQTLSIEEFALFEGASRPFVSG